MHILKIRKAAATVNILSLIGVNKWVFLKRKMKNGIIAARNYPKHFTRDYFFFFLLCNHSG